MFISSLLASVLLALASSVQAQGHGLKCHTRQPSALKVSVNSRRNQTGYWISKVGLQQWGLSDQTGSTVDVEHSTVSCVGIDESVLNIGLVFTAPPHKEREDYELFPGIGMYKFHTDVANWTSARRVCTEEGAHLVIINSEREADVMKTLFARYQTIAGASHNDFSWVGIQRIGEDYFTVLGDTLASTGFTRWLPEQPHRGNEYCILVQRNSGGLADITCDWKVAFICEQ